MTEQVITFETAKLAKEKNFDEVTEYIFMTNHTTEVLFENINRLKHSDGNNPFISAPTQSFLQKWLRDVHKIHIEIICGVNNKEEYEYYAFVKENRKLKKSLTTITYEKALEAALVHALNLIP